MGKKLVLKISPNEWKNASRDKRELSVCREMGYDTAVLAKGNPEDRGRIDGAEGFAVHRYSTRPLGRIIPAPLNRVVSMFTWAAYARSLHPDIISGHDIKGLLIGWMSNYFSKKKANLIYDSHEFELGRNVRRNAIQLWGVKHLERFLIRRCAFSIMVNDSIADEVQRIHKLKERPMVVRSTPERWSIPEAQIRERREEFEEKLKHPTGIIMYHGLLTPGRGVENVIDVVAGIPGLGAVILGNPSTPEYMAQLERYATDRKVRERIYFHPAVPFESLKAYVAAADLGVILSDVPTRSYYYGLPNKFFENIQAQTPVVVTALPEMERLVRQYDIGMVCPVGDIEAAKASVKKLLGDRECYQRMKVNLRKAKMDLCWENEKTVLMNAYRAL